MGNGERSVLTTGNTGKNKICQNSRVPRVPPWLDLEREAVILAYHAQTLRFNPIHSNLSKSDVFGNGQRLMQYGKAIAIWGYVYNQLNIWEVKNG
jgi:hypothetical protein